MIQGQRDKRLKFVMKTGPSIKTLSFRWRSLFPEYEYDYNFCLEDVSS